MPGVPCKLPPGCPQVWAGEMLHLGQQLQSVTGDLGRSCLSSLEWAPLFSLWAWRPHPPNTQLHSICPAGRTLKADLDALRVFKMFMISKMGEKAKTKKPPHAGNEKGFPFFPSCCFSSVSVTAQRLSNSSSLPWSADACELPRDS